MGFKEPFNTIKVNLEKHTCMFCYYEMKQTISDVYNVYYAVMIKSTQQKKKEKKILSQSYVLFFKPVDFVSVLLKQQKANLL